MKLNIISDSKLEQNLVYKFQNLRSKLTFSFLVFRSTKID